MPSPSALALSLLRPLAAHRVGLVAAVLALALGWQAAGLAWSLAPRPALPVALPERGAASSAQTAETGPSTDLGQLALFGQPAAGASGIEVRKPDLQQARVPLKLQGVFVFADPNRSRALVAQKGEPAETYRVGDTLPGGFELTAVEPRRIVFQRNGELRSLALNPDEPQGDSGSGSGGDGEIDARRVIEGRPQDFRALLGRAQLVEVSYQGRQAVRVADIPEGGTLAELGLQAGDILLSLNGTPLNAATDPLKLMQQLREANRLTLRLVRDGEQRTFAYDMVGS